MSFNFLNQLPSPEEIKKEYPLPEKLAQIKKERDAMESGGTARHHHTDAAVVDKKRGRSSALSTATRQQGNERKVHKGNVFGTESRG